MNDLKEDMLVEDQRYVEALELLSEVERVGNQILTSLRTNLINFT